MNVVLADYARNWLLHHINMLPQKCHETFKLMYGMNVDDKGNPRRTADEAKALSILEVLDEMLPEKYDWAMVQVMSSLKREGINI